MKAKTKPASKRKVFPQHLPKLALVNSCGPEIEMPDYPRIEPGLYPAYCKWAKIYWDRGFRRWTCLLRFDVLSDDLLQARACLPMWLNLGSDKERPRAGRRSNYFKEYVRAGGKARADRRSPKNFLRRMARVQVGDTKSAPTYSVVRKILFWDTGQSLPG